MWYVESKKSFKIRSEKKTYLFAKCQKTLGKIISLPSAKEKHSASLLLCRVSLMDTRQTTNGWHTKWRMSTWWFFAKCLCFADCFFLVYRVVFFQHLAKILVCRVLLFCRVWFLKHSTDNFFVECLMKCTWQIFWHSANLLFLVVLVWNMQVFVLGCSHRLRVWLKDWGGEGYL